eukprot:GFYU01042651.1.p1 GENE.GFYU01042651.1~~GFYU01042651.1.p1  ORF type:complete len:173 (+),score=32.18 GFYU01042651.1:49-567(+)
MITPKKHLYLRRVRRSSSFLRQLDVSLRSHSDSYFARGLVHMREKGRWEIPLHPQLGKPAKLSRQELLVMADCIGSTGEVYSILLIPLVIGAWHLAFYDCGQRSGWGAPCWAPLFTSAAIQLAVELATDLIVACMLGVTRSKVYMFVSSILDNLRHEALTESDEPLVPSLWP